MNLLFYSGGFPDENIDLDNILLSLTDKKNLQITFIPSSSYMANEEFIDFIKQYEKFGIQRILKFEVDQPFSQTLKEEVLKSDIIHLGGGNTFYFLKHLRSSGLLGDLKKWALTGGTLSGLSAGAIILTNNINMAAIPNFDCDDNDEEIKNLKSMNLVKFEFFPHYKNSKRYDLQLADYSKKISVPLYACPDGSGIAVCNKEVRFIGKTYCFYQGYKHVV